jgi:dTDP-4-amino-4,6-dideoxygalactose transaminase
VIARNKARYDAYRRACERLPGLDIVPCTDTGGERSNYRMVIAGVTPEWALTRDETVSLLRAEGAAINAYWHPALHRSVHAPPGAPVPELPVAEGLAERFLHVPVGEFVSLADIERIADRLEIVARNGAAVAKRMRSSVPA